MLTLDEGRERGRAVTPIFVRHPSVIALATALPSSSVLQDAIARSRTPTPGESTIHITILRLMSPSLRCGGESPAARRVTPVDPRLGRAPSNSNKQ